MGDQGGGVDHVLTILQTSDMHVVLCCMWAPVLDYQAGRVVT
jgi:hypothetical protein